MPSLRYVTSDQIRFHCELSFPPRQIEHYRFLYVESGQGQFRIADNRFEVSAGWLGLLSPGLRENHYVDSEPVSYLFVEFATPERLIRPHFAEFTFSDPQRSALVWLLRTIDHQRSDHDGSLLSAALRLMFPEDRASTASQLDPRLADVVAMVQLHPERNLTVTELAATAGLSEPHLRRLFRTQLQTSPKQFLLRTRMEFAQRLLTIEGLRVGEVARLLGFETVYQFSAQYRHIMKHPPSVDRTSE